jgi:pyruvate/2-oxoacid:ferredoxin oxidoreductase beta subunit
MSKEKKMRLTLPEEELVGSGNLACQGCGANLALRYVLKAYGKRTAICIPACCWAVIDGAFPHSCLGIPVYHCAFETAASTATGVKAGLEMVGDTETQVIAWAGDGGTFDIGIQALSGAAERNDNILYVCYDNEAYMNTGIQRSSATPLGAWTTTTPVKFPKNEPKKDIDAIMAAHRIPYQATASIAYPEDLYKKAVKAKNTPGTKFLHVYAPCPTGWKSRPEDAVKLGRLAVQTCLFPLYEVEHGEKYTLNMKVQNKKPIEDYIRLQGRYRHLKPDAVAAIQEGVDRDWERLLKKVNAG